MENGIGDKEKEEVPLPVTLVRIPVEAGSSQGHSSVEKGPAAV